MDDITPVLLLVAAAVAAILLVSGIRLVVKPLFRESPTASLLISRVYRPGQFLAALICARIAIEIVADEDWHDDLRHGLLFGMIAAVAWLASNLLEMVRSKVEYSFGGESQADYVGRRRRTQILVIHRMVSAAIWVVAIGVMLLTFEPVRAVGASLLASAGLLGIVAGLAAQTALKNIFAGVALAFSDAIRLEDVVVVEGEWGRIEEITMTFVVVRIWDDRRLILPSSYFTEQPYVSWTRESQDVLGTIQLDVDWRLPVDEARTELQRVVEASQFWDGRLCSIIVEEATGTLKRLRPLVSAADADSQWFLRCEVREKLIDWIVREYPDYVPNLRVRTDGSAGSAAG